MKRSAKWQGVFHYHVNLIPRYADDQFRVPRRSTIPSAQELARDGGLRTPRPFERIDPTMSLITRHPPSRLLLEGAEDRMRAGRAHQNSPSDDDASPARPPKADRQWWTIFALLVMTVGAIVLFREATRETEPPGVINQPAVSQAELDRRLAERQAQIQRDAQPTTMPMSHQRTTDEQIARQPSR